MKSNLKVIETKRLAKETIQDALNDCEGWQASIVLGIRQDGSGQVWHSDITPMEMAFLKEILDCRIREMFEI